MRENSLKFFQDWNNAWLDRLHKMEYESARLQKWHKIPMEIYKRLAIQKKHLKWPMILEKIYNKLKRKIGYELVSEWSLKNSLVPIHHINHDFISKVNLCKGKRRIFQIQQIWKSELWKAKSYEYSSQMSTNLDGSMAELSRPPWLWSPFYLPLVS